MMSGGHPGLGNTKLCCHTQDALLIFEKCQFYGRIDSLESYSMGIVELLSLSALLKLALISWNLIAGELREFLQCPRDEKVWKTLHRQYQYYSHEWVSYGDFIRSFDFLLLSKLPFAGQASQSETAISRNYQMAIPRTYFNRESLPVISPVISLPRVRVIPPTTDPVLSFSERLRTYGTHSIYYRNYGPPYRRHVLRHSIYHPRVRPGHHRMCCVRQQPKS